MSKSLKRVRTVLESAGATFDLREMPDSTRTAQAAADAIGCTLDQIAKSIVVEGESSGTLSLFVTAGGNRVCTRAIAGLLGEPTHPADGARIRQVTGFAIGGVSPIGHKTPIRAWFDPRLNHFEQVWAAAGTPRHVFGIDPATLRDLAAAQLATFTE
ncbi:prolyl-tRNA editing enzyme YbaK/EbsC (Cys-tRNA(Pro) deacylase) [Aliiruegeria haliotis]|uniref:Prolyl-tRNA editing enzyme YbaK/EbsC (Cys-tRNA(Pro) deacylase) n=1 Tax=Aliiruegeria haliotis TaxID=1280846 RepID=A0A2T0RJX5_9RHOB|nr:YbaK/EbsC family protein [Aliiruegeria haliotis]PRY21483.1 prolyl-tRNA editing enzyme YbaK/EbsC (Cys-tRNA(Pro) deacylase) [Aliiruegeria haliotis]